MTELEHLTKLIETAMYWGADTPEKTAERLIDEGVIITPCKVGDTVWIVRNLQIERWKVVSIEKAASYMRLGIKFIARGVRSAPILINTRCIGEIIFLTREEAEAALAERRKV